MCLRLFFDGRVKIEFKSLNILAKTDRYFSCKLFLVLRYPAPAFSLLCDIWPDHRGLFYRCYPQWTLSQLLPTYPQILLSKFAYGLFEYVRGQGFCSLHSIVTADALQSTWTPPQPL
jgi:hypothetical protein